MKKKKIYQVLVMGLVVGQVLTNGTTFAYAATLERNLLDESKFSDERMDALNDQYQPVTYVYHKITINEAPKIPSQLQNKELVETQNKTANKTTNKTNYTATNKTTKFVKNERKEPF